ncbi:hypothetical protein [Microbacterium sp.]|uniref:hypothetical protein n=1 Tax=Microbacterium sp. TaxID=51671 RepID=UPI0035B1ACDD
MNISVRTALGLVAAAVLATGLVTGTAVTFAVGDPGGEKPPASGRSDASAESDAAAAVSYGVGTELLYVPITPCRIVDTRAGGGKLAAGAIREFYVGGTTGFPGQGGTSGGCGIPPAAAAVSLSLTSTQASASGRLVAYPSAVSAPGSTMLSYTAASNATSTPTAAITPYTERQIEVKNFSASVHLVIDVLGYYTPQMSAYVNNDGTLWIASRGVSSTRVDVGMYEVTFDTDITYCNGIVSPAIGGYTAGVFPNGDIAEVKVTDADGVPADAYFNLVIVC